MLKEEPGLTQSEMARRLNTSRRTVQRIIKELYINGYLSRSGSKKSGQWVVHDKS
ncbi:MAG: MarR family transcriptional regulator [Firmicutes bacterium]|nr:MarR family transcriptional regulator [Bacillota bacterium]